MTLYLLPWIEKLPEARSFLVDLELGREGILPVGREKIEKHALRLVVGC
jgi:hypothetical protein